ncbi:MAG TPA: transketolase C-terminal domain-containing protein [Pyrinomonadaceae bacterium]
MRTAFIEALVEAAEVDERIWLLTGDLGYSVLERFAQKFPKRFLNVGVAEQNLIGVASGLAMSGRIVYAYSIANFPVMRCLEQIRNDVCYHNLNVKIVAVGGGFAYGPAGYTHHALEDLAVMRSLPGMTVIAPGDPVEARQATKAVAEWPGPCYLRLGKAGEPIVHLTPPHFRIGKGLVARDGSDVTLISTGGMLKNTLEAAELLSAQKISARVLSMHTLKPLDVQAVSDAARSTRLLCAIEEHGEIGGLSDAIARCLAEQSLKCAFLAFNISVEAGSMIGSQSYLLDRAGLSAEGISQRIVEILKR